MLRSSANKIVVIGNGMIETTLSIASMIRVPLRGEPCGTPLS